MKPLIIQFSGGRTSGFMTKFLFEYFPEREKHVLFENTGKEDPRTLDFVNECDRRWGLGVTWLEAVVRVGKIINSRKHIFELKQWGRLCANLRKRDYTEWYINNIPTFPAGTRHKVVTYETASRDGKPFEDVIKKYGIPNQIFQCCSRELKKNVANSYVSSLGLEDCETAIGIRADEAHRINRVEAKKNKLIYPLTDLIQVDKRFINEWWAKQDFDLQLPHYLGNCDLCFKKSINKLVVIAREHPEKVSWWEDMGRKYAGVGPQVGERVFYRGYRTAQDIRELASAPTLFSNPEFEVETDCFCKST